MRRREAKCIDCEGSRSSRDRAIRTILRLAVNPSNGDAAIGADIGDGRILAAEEELT